MILQLSSIALVLAMSAAPQNGRGSDTQPTAAQAPPIQLLRHLVRPFRMRRPLANHSRRPKAAPRDRPLANRSRLPKAATRPCHSAEPCCGIRISLTLETGGSARRRQIPRSVCPRQRPPRQAAVCLDDGSRGRPRRETRTVHARQLRLRNRVTSPCGTNLGLGRGSSCARRDHPGCGDRNGDGWWRFSGRRTQPLDR